MWFNKSIIYQIYPLGFFGAPTQNDGKLEHRILNFLDFIPHLTRLNIDAVYFCSIFESSAHGYDTMDFKKLDCRLGNNDDFKKVCDELHKNNIKIILDGVFNHVGRDFWAFSDVRNNRYDSIYKDWFYINFDANNNYNDGFWYEGWEGHFELVKLNLDNPAVKNYLFECVNMWIDEFKIDGLRLDVAYMLNRTFIKELHDFCKNKNPEFFLAGEMIHGNYNEIVNPEMLDSATNYECFKGIYSSFNSMNMFEIGHSLQRQFGMEDWCLYRGKHLICFVDNHDVTRLASNLTNENHMTLAYGLLFAMPGIPCIYYGSEWGILGKKEDGDLALRPEISSPEWNNITDFIQKVAQAHKDSEALCFGGFKILHMTNKQLIFERKSQNERVIVMINADENEYTAHYNADAGCGTDLISGNYFDFGAGSLLPPYSVQYIKIC